MFKKTFLEKKVINSEKQKYIRLSESALFFEFFLFLLLQIILNLVEDGGLNKGGKLL